MLIIHQDNSFIKRVKLSTELSWIWNTRILSKEYCFFVIFVVPFTIDLKLLPIYMYQHLVFTISVYYKPFYSVVSFHTCCTKQIYKEFQKYLKHCTLFWLNGLPIIIIIIIIKALFILSGDIYQHYTTLVLTRCLVNKIYNKINLNCISKTPKIAKIRLLKTVNLRTSKN